MSDPLQFNGSWAEEQTRALSAYHDVAVVYPLLDQAKVPGIEEFDYNGVKTLIVNYRHVRKTWISPYVLALWRGLHFERLPIKPECIHAHGLYPAGFASVLVGGALRIPVVVTEHWGRLKDRTAESRLIRTVLKFTLQRAARVIAVSEFLASEVQGLEPRCKPTVVPNIIAPIFFDSNLPSVRNFRDRVELLFVGSLRDYRKGLDVLLRALRIYLDSDDAPGCHLSIVGEGGKRSVFEELARNLGLQHNCTFFGNQSRWQVAEKMSACDLFVMPSKYETFGVVYGEAMACGKPVIACLGGPAEEIIPQWAGELAPSDDPTRLAQVIRDVISRLPVYDPVKITEYARQRFGSEAVVTALSKEYERAIG